MDREIENLNRWATEVSMQEYHTPALYQVVINALDHIRRV